MLTSKLYNQLNRVDDEYDELNTATNQFISELQARPDVVGIILFGSWARGNNRPESDVDLLVIVTGGFKRTVDYRGSQAFEIIYTTAESALAFWRDNLNDCAGLWQVAQVVYDPNGTVRDLRIQAAVLLAAGKTPLDDDSIRQLRFDADDQLTAIDHLFTTDPTTAQFLLHQKVFALTELYFDLRQQWTPAPKQRLAVIKSLNPALCSLLETFYSDRLTLTEKLDTARKITQIVFTTD